MKGMNHQGPSPSMPKRVTNLRDLAPPAREGGIKPTPAYTVRRDETTPIRTLCIPTCQPQFIGRCRLKHSPTISLEEAYRSSKAGQHQGTPVPGGFSTTGRDNTCQRALYPSLSATVHRLLQVAAYLLHITPPNARGSLAIK
jgi:hypothetical protein